MSDEAMRLRELALKHTEALNNAMEEGNTPDEELSRLTQENLAVWRAYHDYLDTHWDEADC